MWLISLTLGITILTLWIIWRKRRLSIFQKYNIPGPPPNLIFGNFWEIFFKGQHVCIEEWMKKYGKVFGYYYGLRPVIIVADLELLRKIQQKEFHKFSNRPKLFEVGRNSNRFNNHAITTLEGKRWKELRSIITPTFTTSKLKMISYIINGVVDELVEAVEREGAAGKSFDIYQLYQNLTMDAIARTSLGVHSQAQRNKNEPFLKLARIIFTLKMTFISVLTFSFTEFMSVFSTVRALQLRWKNDGKHPRKEMIEKVQAAIKARRNDPNSRRTDVLQLMIDAQKTEQNVNDNSLTAGENDGEIQNGVTPEGNINKKSGMTDDEIEHNAVLFLLAGYETTSTALAFITHCLVHNQDVQDKVREEIIEKIPDDKNLTYEAINSLQYLDCVFNEALRMFPPIIYFTNRKATEDIFLNGIHIPKEVALQVPVYNLHHDPTIWHEPEKFNPDRFTPEQKRNRDPMAFQPFGAGPRNCVGMRFAQMEAKMAIVKLLRKYKLLPEKGTTEKDFKYLHTLITLRPENGVVIRIEKV